MGNSDSPLDLAPQPKARGVALRRFLAFAALATGLTLAAVFVAKTIPGIDVDVDAKLSMKEVFIGEFVLAIVDAVLPTAIMICMTREPALSFGWGRSARWRQFGIGVTAGLGLMSALLAVIWLLGGFSFGKVVLTSAQAVQYGLTYCLAFVLTAVSEEGLLRGYALVQLSRAISFWPAAIVTSALFVALHFHGPNWLTGGPAGPEGSMVVLPILGALAFITHAALRPTAPEHPIALCE
jgi:uncharacterized protein